MFRSAKIEGRDYLENEEWRYLAEEAVSLKVLSLAGYRALGFKTLRGEPLPPVGTDVAEHTVRGPEWLRKALFMRLCSLKADVKAGFTPRESSERWDSKCGYGAREAAPVSNVVPLARSARRTAADYGDEE